MSERILEHILVKQRWFFVLFFLAPVSVIYSAAEKIKRKLAAFRHSDLETHNAKLKQIQQQIQLRNLQAPTKKMCTSRPGWKAMSFRSGLYKKNLWNINLQKLDSIFKIDKENMLVWVEPMVNMKQLTMALNPLGLTIPVLPELDDLTVGGLIMGMGVESQSYKYGLFQHTCEYLDILLPSSEVVRCSKEENSELYYAIPGSYGTIGFLAAAAIKLIPARKYVKIQYVPVQKPDCIEKALILEMDDTENDFIEAIAYSDERSVIIKGKMTDSYEPGKKNAIGNFWKPWFYKHAEKALEHNKVIEEYIPLGDYYHRHSRSIFWELSDIIPFGNHPLYRYLFGWSLPLKISLLKRTQGKTIKKLYEKHHIIQDMILPIKELSSTLNFFHEIIALYPIWICPLKLYKNPGMLKTPSTGSQMYVDIGIYGNVRIPNYQAKETTRELEKYVREKRGFQMLYADCYMSKDEFKQMFDHSLYDKIRTQYGCENAFPEVYDKINIKARS